MDMNRTAVTILSSDKVHLDAIARALKSDPDMRLSEIHGSTSELTAIQDAPDVIIVNGRAAEEGGLDMLERLGHVHPSTAFIVVSENQSPEFLRRAMRAGVREVLPCPAPAEQLRATVDRMKRRRTRPEAKGRVLAFIPVKGGAGSTFLATNLGYILAGHGGKKVLFLDLNLQFGDAALFLSEQQPASDLAEVARQIHRIDASFLASSLLNVLPNFGVLAAPDDPAHSVDIKPQHVETIIAIARQHYEYIVVDLGRSLDGVSLKALDMADAVFPVLQLGLPYIRDGKRLLGVMKALGYPSSKINLIVNRYEKSSEIGIADVEKALGLNVFKTIPNSYQASTASVNQGVPIAKLARNNPVSRSLSELASVIAPASADGQSGNWLSRMLGRA
jgi:pilus assembly protein CpaE